MSTKKLVFMSLLTAAALSMYVIENALPPIAPIPAVRMGLANTVTLFALYLGGKWRWSDAALILTARLLLGALVMGTTMTLLFSTVGGALALAAMLLSKKLLNPSETQTISTTSSAQTPSETPTISTTSGTPAPSETPNISTTSSASTKPKNSRSFLWITSIFGAVFHIIGQLLSAVFIYGTAVLFYSPVLIISAIVSGAFTGVLVMLVFGKLGKLCKALQSV